jgi:hypothetical protein
VETLATLSNILGDWFCCLHQNEKASCPYRFGHGAFFMRSWQRIQPSPQSYPVPICAIASGWNWRAGTHFILRCDRALLALGQMGSYHGCRCHSLRRSKDRWYIGLNKFALQGHSPKAIACLQGETSKTPMTHTSSRTLLALCEAGVAPSELSYCTIALSLSSMRLGLRPNGAAMEQGHRCYRRTPLYAAKQSLLAQSTEQ